MDLKYGGAFESTPTHKLIFSSNEQYKDEKY